MKAPRRYSERIPFFCRVVLRPIQGGPWIETRSFDINLGGVGLVSPIPIPSDRILTVIFHLQEPAQGEVVEAVLGRAVRCEAEGPGSIVGVEFLGPLDRSSSPRLLARIGGETAADPEPIGAATRPPHSG